jgi:hypothetical protein
MRYFMDVLDAEFVEELHAGDVDEKGAIRERRDKLEAAYALGKQLVGKPNDKEATGKG